MQPGSQRESRPERIGPPDTGDVVGADASDPPREPVTDPADPSYVEPAADAVAHDVSRETSGEGT